jgi:DNA N-6-adenine-methyltransferase (Dam)
MKTNSATELTVELRDEIAAVPILSVPADQASAITALAYYEEACRAVAQVKNVAQALDLLSHAVGMKAYAERAKDKTLEIDASEIRFRAERRVGQLLKLQKASVGLAKGGGDQKSDQRGKKNPGDLATLEEAGIDKNLAKVARRSAALSDAKFETVLAERRETMEAANAKVTVDLLGGGKPRGTQGTGEFERFTPAQHIAAARAVLGTIDLDPCTCAMAQATVKAEKHFTADDDGLTQEWHGKVWMNPPYHRTLQTLFVDKLLAEIKAGRVTEAIMLTNNSTDTQWFKVAAEASTAVCFTIGRVAFNTPEGVDVAPTQGQAFFYFGDNPARFMEVFTAIGFGMSVDWHYSAEPPDAAAA